jgi:hypothetical protein
MTKASDCVDPSSGDVPVITIGSDKPDWVVVGTIVRTSKVVVSARVFKYA